MAEGRSADLLERQRDEPCDDTMLTGVQTDWMVETLDLMVPNRPKVETTIAAYDARKEKVAAPLSIHVRPDLREERVCRLVRIVA